MAQVIAAIKGQMGNVPYYEAVMSAQGLVSIVRPASELDDWATWGIEERMQRDVHEKRVRDELVPYLAKSPDRFFGSMIVLVYRPRIFEFEPVGTLGKLPAAYTTVAQNMGFLTLEGGDLIVLDGQHRLRALRDIISPPDKHRPDGEFVTDIPHDEVSVLFVEFESMEKTRRMFNKVNRYAKPTSRADNIITSEDDGYAILARWLMRRGELFGYVYNDKREGRNALIVDWKGNTITGRSQKFTTVSVLHDTARDILTHHGFKDFDEKSRVIRPSDEELDRAYEYLTQWWEDILTGVTTYKAYLEEVEANQESNTLDRREDDQPYSLLYKPAGQIALVKGLVKAVERGMEREVAVRRVNKIDWRTTSDIWVGSIVTPNGRMSTTKEAYDLAAEVIAYLVGSERMEPKDVEELETRYNEARGYVYEDPKPEGKPEPEGLPEPITTP